MVSTFIVAGLLLAAAIGTALWQQRAWKGQQAEAGPSFETDFYRRRHERRMRISSLLGVVAVSMVIGLWIADPLVLGLYWLGVLALLLWIILLATMDFTASHAYFDRLRARQLAEHASLERELRAKLREGSDSDSSG
jgi:hypothetical protein